jgi:hypothetical protein
MSIIPIQNKIYEIRGLKVMLDFDLAELYEVETRVLNQAVKRNIDLLPHDFMFKLNKKEWELMSSQIVMTFPSRRPKKALPFAFTEHGVVMLANILKSKKARLTSVAIVRAFIALKQYSMNYVELARKIKILEEQYNREFKDIYEVLNYLMHKEKREIEQKNRKKIGY